MMRLACGLSSVSCMITGKCVETVEMPIAAKASPNTMSQKARVRRA